MMFVFILLGIIFTGIVGEHFDYERSSFLDDYSDYQEHEINEQFHDEILKRKHGKKSGNTNWDTLIFTQTWSPSDCISWRDKSLNHRCRNLEKNGKEQWTIHGIWPNRVNTIGPHFCDKSKRFVAGKISDLMDALKIQWPTIEEFSNNFHFWRHEWEKHGTCAIQIPQLNSEHKYFSQGLIWNERYHPDKLLKPAGIRSGNAYSLTDLWQVIKQGLGVNPQIACFNHRGNIYLQEIRICFDKSLNLIDCNPTNIYGLNSNPDDLLATIQAHTVRCNIRQNVIYPSVQDVE